MNLDAIREREIIARRRDAVHIALLALAAFAVFGAIVWTYLL
jgi:hypothetical protein